MITVDSSTPTEHSVNYPYTHTHTHTHTDTETDRQTDRQAYSQRQTTTRRHQATQRSKVKRSTTVASSYAPAVNVLITLMKHNLNYFQLSMTTS